MPSHHPPSTPPSEPQQERAEAAALAYAAKVPRGRILRGYELLQVGVALMVCLSCILRVPYSWIPAGAIALAGIARLTWWRGHGKRQWAGVVLLLLGSAGCAIPAVRRAVLYSPDAVAMRRLRALGNFRAWVRSLKEYKAEFGELPGNLETLVIRGDNSANDLRNAYSPDWPDSARCYLYLAGVSLPCGDPSPVLMELPGCNPSGGGLVLYDNWEERRLAPDDYERMRRCLEQFLGSALRP